MTGTIRPSIDSLQHLRDYFSSPRTSSRCLSSFASRLAPTIVQDPKLPIRRRSRQSWSQERLRRDADVAKTVKAWHRRRHVGPQTERASQLSRAKTWAGWAPHWLHRHAQPARWINFGSFAKVCHGKSCYSGFPLFLEQQRAHKYHSLTKKSGAYHTSFNHQRSTKSPSQTQKCM